MKKKLACLIPLLLLLLCLYCQIWTFTKFDDRCLYFFIVHWVGILWGSMVPLNIVASVGLAFTSIPTHLKVILPFVNSLLIFAWILFCVLVNLNITKIPFVTFLGASDEYHEMGRSGFCFLSPLWCKEKRECPDFHIFFPVCNFFFTNMNNCFVYILYLRLPMYQGLIPRKNY